MDRIKRTLCLDFDGVIHSYTSGWQGADVIADQPVPGAREFVIAALEHFDVAVFSSRSGQPGGIPAMTVWMRKHGFPVDRVTFPTAKPAAWLTIDDRALMFTGVWPAMDELLEFRPWNKESDRAITRERTIHLQFDDLFIWATGAPVPGIKELLREMTRHFYVMIHSPSLNQDGGLESIRMWMLEQDLLFEGIVFPY